MTTAAALVVGLSSGFFLGWLVALAVTTSERRMRLLTRRFWRLAHRARDAERRRRMVQLVDVGMWMHTVGRN